MSEMSETPAKAILEAVEGRPGVYTYAETELRVSRLAILGGIALADVAQAGLRAIAFLEARIETLEGMVAYLEGSIPDDPRAEADLIDARRIRQERDDAVLAHHLALARIEALDATARAERSHSMSVEEDLERMDKVIEYWKNLAERLRARIEELEKLASHEAHCACVPTLEARIEALERKQSELREAGDWLCSYVRGYREESAKLAVRRWEALAAKERPGNASCACVFSTATGTVDTTGCSLHGSALAAEEKEP